MAGQNEFNAMWKTADSSVPTKNDNQADDSKHLFLNKQCFSIIECEEKWKLPDSSVITPTQEVTNQVINSVQVKEEGPDDYDLPGGINMANGQMTNDLSGPFGNLGQSAVSGIMDSGGKFGQVQQELPALGQELMMSYSYPPRTQPITYQKTSNDSNYCAECGKSFSCNRSFRRHMLVHTGARPFHCKDCGRAFSRKDSLLAHERRHRRKTTHFRYQCQQCGINFLNSFQLKTHEQLHTSPASSSNQNEGLVENVIVSNPLGLLTARPYIIPEPRPATINYDDASQNSISPAPSANNLSDKKLHRCPLCRKLFTKQYAMNLHMKTHMIHMFHCEYCGKVFRFRRNKQIHVLKFHNKLQCMQCQRSFPNPEALRSHQLQPCSNSCNMNELLAPSQSGQNQIQSGGKSGPVIHCKCGSAILNQADLQEHADVCNHRASSIQSSSGCFYYTSSDGNVIESTERAVSDNLLTAGGQQSSEVFPIQDTIESSNSSEVSNPVLQCNVCNSRLEKPRTLACTHSFCHACLENCLDKSKSTLSCPTCQLVIVIPDGDLSHLQANQMISSLLSEVQNSEQQMYPLCIVCDVNASHHCQQCDAFICIKCSAAHLKLPATKDHTQISLTEYNTKDPRERMASTVVMCKEHDSPSQFFCSSCQKPICVGCTLVDHPKGSEHEIIDLSSAFQAFCTATEPMMSECEELENKLCSAMDEMKPILQIGHQIRYKCRESIQSYVAKLRAGLDKLQHELLLEVDELTTDKQMAIDSRLDSLKRELEDVKGTRLLANQLITSPNKALALTLTSDISQHLKDLLDKSPPTSDHKAKKALKFTPCEDLLEVILQKGIGSLEETDVSESELQSEVIMIE